MHFCDDTFCRTLVYILIMNSSAGELPRVVSLLNSGSDEQTVAMLKVLKGICANSKLRVT